MWHQVFAADLGSDSEAAPVTILVQRRRFCLGEELADPPAIGLCEAVLHLSEFPTFDLPRLVPCLEIRKNRQEFLSRGGRPEVLLRVAHCCSVLDSFFVHLEVDQLHGVCGFENCLAVAAPNVEDTLLFRPRGQPFELGLPDLSRLLRRLAGVLGWSLETCRTDAWNGASKHEGMQTLATPA